LKIYCYLLNSSRPFLLNPFPPKDGMELDLRKVRAGTGSGISAKAKEINTNKPIIIINI